MLLNCGAGEDSWVSLGQQEIKPTNLKGNQPWIFIGRTDTTLTTWCKEQTYWKRLWCWERLKVGREGDDRGWDGWVASPTWWTWIWASSGSWWWTGRPGLLQFMGSQRVEHDWATELNWTELSPSSRGFLVPLHFLPLEWYQLHIWDCWYFSWQFLFQLVLNLTQHFTWCTLYIS